jgi:(2R)-ethylmalonyl-CoA mutase
MQQVLAYESDLLDYDDLFAGSHVIETKTAALVAAAQAEIDRILDLGGALAAVEGGYLKSALVQSHSRRRAAIESGEHVVVGVNAFTTTEQSPLTTGDGQAGAIQGIDAGAEAAAIEGLRAWREQRDPAAVEAALAELRVVAESSQNILAATLNCARAGVTTGEWAGALRAVFGDYRAPTGLSGTTAGESTAELDRVREAVRLTGGELGSRLRILVGKPGLDGHSNGAEQIAVRARDAGFEVVYQGIRLTTAEIVAAAVEEDVHCVGLSILSGAHRELVPAVLDGLRAAGAGDVPVVVGGIIPEPDAAELRRLGVAAVFTPKDYDLTAVIGQIVQVIRRVHGLASSIPAGAPVGAHDLEDL